MRVAEIPGRHRPDNRYFAGQHRGGTDLGELSCLAAAIAVHHFQAFALRGQTRSAANGPHDQIMAS